MRYLLTAIAIILWFLLGYFLKPCWDDNCGKRAGDDKAMIDDSKKDAVAPIKESPNKVTGPILFNWENAEPILGDGWDARRNSIIEGLGETDILEITGQYRADENETEQLGLARAAEVAKLFKPPLTDDRVRLRAQLVKTIETDKTNLFKSVSFRNQKNSASIKEIDDKTLIYFPFNSTNKLNDSKVEAYLNDVAERVKKTGEKVSLTGHTDNIGSDASNITLGNRRAKIVRDYLLSKGVKSSQIITDSKGESSPVATNATSDGRAANRRTELQIIK